MTILEYLKRNRAIMKLSVIERSLNMHNGILHNAIEGKVPLPKKWEPVLERWAVAWRKEAEKIS